MYTYICIHIHALRTSGRRPPAPGARTSPGTSRRGRGCASLSIYLSIYLCIYISIYLSLSLYIYICIYRYIYIYIYTYDMYNVYMYMYIYVYIYIYIYMCIHIHMIHTHNELYTQCASWGSGPPGPRRPTSRRGGRGRGAEPTM